MDLNKIYNKSSESMEEIDDNSVDLVVTSPPYNIDIQYGQKWKDRKPVESKGKKYSDDMEEEEYRKMLEKVFDECKRVLKDSGSIWVNLKNKINKKDIETPFWVFEYFNDMHMKNMVIWQYDWGAASGNRFSPSYEYFFWWSMDKEDYKFNLDNVKVPVEHFRPDRWNSQLKNPGDVWEIPRVSGNFEERTNHPAQFPEELIKRIILSCTDRDDVVLDPFMGSGTTAKVARDAGRKYIGYEVEEEYIEICEERLSGGRQATLNPQEKYYGDLNNHIGDENEQ